MEPAGHVHPVSVSTSRERSPDTGTLIGVGHAAAVTTGVLALSCQSPHWQSRPRRRADHLVFHMTVDGLPCPQHTDVHQSC